MTKREATWVVWGLGFGAAACFVAIFGFGFRTHADDGRLVAVVSYLTSEYAEWEAESSNKQTQATERRTHFNAALRPRMGGYYGYHDHKKIKSACHRFSSAVRLCRASKSATPLADR